MFGVPIPDHVTHRYATLPRALYDLIAGPDEVPYQLIRPQLDAVSDVEVWLRSQGWNGYGLQARESAARGLLFAAWRLRGVRLARRGMP